jgi:lysine-N-methylase
MSLPIVILPTAEKWDCHQCGICCRGSLVPLNDGDVARLEGQKWSDHPDYRDTPVMVRYPSSKKRFRLAQRKDGSCVFLNDNGLCRIHSDLGYEAKPTICRVFPLQLIPRDGNAALTIRRACPSSAADKGSPLNEHLPFMQQFVREGRLTTKRVDPPSLKTGEDREWKTLSLVLETASELLLDQRFPPVRRLVHTLQFANLLGKAKTRRMDDKKLGDLISTLAEITPEESKPFFSDRQPPGAYSKLLFRSMGIEYARLHPQFRAVPSWSHRVELGRTWFRLVFGRGRLPDVRPAFPLAEWNDLEEPLGLLAPAIDYPLARLIEASSASYIYALADRRGWSVVDSIRGLVATFPIGLWLLRWASLGREATTEDMIQIVVALDRGQGFAPLTGQLQRLRLHLLANNNELERLIVWYAR